MNHGSKALKTIADTLQKQEYFLAEQRSKEHIRNHPLEAQGWAYLGEALLSRGFGAAARAVFERARLLDPEATWMLSISKELDKREEGPERYDVELLLKTDKVKVSGAVLVRNGEAAIERCIRSLQGAVDEIVVLDYGSTDRTIPIVMTIPQIKLIQAEWKDSFADLRNEMHTHITGDWVLWIEPNEELHPQDKAKVREAAALFHLSESPAALDVITVSVKNGATVETFTGPRMYSLKWGLSYTGRVKEQLLPSVSNGAVEPLLIRRKINLRLIAMESQASPNNEETLRLQMKLLERMLEDEPDNPRWSLHYSEELVRQGRIDEALIHVELAAQKAQDVELFPHRLELLVLQIRLMMDLSRWQEAEQIVREGLSAFPDYPDFHYYLSQIHLHRAEELYREAALNLRLAQEGFVTYRGPDPMDHDILDWKSTQMNAELALGYGELAAAETMYDVLAERFPESKEIQTRLRRIENQHMKLTSRSGEVSE